MSNETNEIFDATISYNRLLWIMDDESSDKLIAIIQAHLCLVKEHLCNDTLPDRKEAIRADIERLRAERSAILLSFNEAEVENQHGELRNSCRTRR
ncbi:hypothetical protein LOZ80_31550 [Paenibacillus sp. HWE-109]|uniref:hypothetical protein n=1 Tax=Paenibacillus sp. HWE-109 TaxID=1306526 RepID=UPI001EDEAF96|nr:hypothetical protein [Paenibacillus sp. HWE-109]UKS26040.1 hypothetical protein LOZ80_31550 [Paenibacillus sp. HWE-109]